MASLTQTRWRVFAKQFFATNCDAHEAYRLAGYKSRSANAERATISGLLTNPNVQQYMAEEFAALVERTGFDQDRAIEETMRLAYSDIRDVISWKNEGGVVVKDSETLSDDTAAAIKSVTSKKKIRRWTENKKPVEEEELFVKVELYDKPKALGQLQTYIMRGTPLTEDAEERLAQLVMVTVRYVPKAALPAFLEAVHDHLGIALPTDATALIAEHRPAPPGGDANGRGQPHAPSGDGT